MSISPRILVDANVLLSITELNWLFFLRSCNPGMFSLCVSEDILAEARYHLRKKYPSSSSTIRGWIDKIKACIDTDNGGEIIDFTDRPGYDYHSAGLKDKHDQHVHFAALDGRVEMLLTNNTRDFPTDGPYEVIHPDNFYILVVHSNPRCLPPILNRQVLHMSRAGKDPQLDRYLTKAGCERFAEIILRAIQLSVLHDLEKVSPSFLREHLFTSETRNIPQHKK